MPYVYIIRSLQGKHYTGSTVDLDVRLARHNAGTGSSTTKGSSWPVVYVKKFDKLSDARREEKRIKSFNGGNAFKALLRKGDVAEWSKAPHC